MFKDMGIHFVWDLFATKRFASRDQLETAFAIWEPKTQVANIRGLDLQAVVAT